MDSKFRSPGDARAPVCVYGKTPVMRAGSGYSFGAGQCRLAYKNNCKESPVLCKIIMSKYAFIYLRNAEKTIGFFGVKR